MTELHWIPNTVESNLSNHKAALVSALYFDQISSYHHLITYFLLQATEIETSTFIGKEIQK